MELGKPRSPGRRIVKIQVNIVSAWREEDKCFIAWSPQLGCVRDGATAKEAIGLCIEAIEVRLESWIERGTLDQNLIKHGYHKDPSPATPRSFAWPTEKELNLNAGYGALTNATLRGVTIEAKERMACAR